LHGKARLREHLRDAGAHCPRADDPDLPGVHDVERSFVSGCLRGCI
jgi:hypothetical protein